MLPFPYNPMSTKNNPVRGFFIGKLPVLAAVAVAIACLAAPKAIRADSFPSGNTVAFPAASAAEAQNPPDMAAAWITAYASVPDETSDHPFITASGERVRDGIVAANFLPFGTQIRIPALFGDKVFTVEDRMNARFDGRVDIWMPTVQNAVDFGIRHAAIVIAAPAGLALAGR